MSADPVILDARGVGHTTLGYAADGLDPTTCCKLMCCRGLPRHPISRLTCPDCIHARTTRTEGAP